MSEEAASSFDPLSELVGLVAGPIAAGIRSVEQVRRAADELLRGVENFNTTMATLNETAARLNRLLDDVEQPIRAAMPQVTRTVRTADELTQRLTSLPFDVADFVSSMMDLSRRLGPLATFAESAGGMFGLRLPGFGRPTPPAASTRTPVAPTPAADPLPDAASAPAAARSTPSTSKRSTTKRSTTKRAGAASSAAKRSTSKRSAPKRSAAKKR